MKQLLLILALLSVFTAYSQKIDSTNYCSFYNMNAHYTNAKVKISTTYLSELEIAQIVYEEMDKLGYDHLYNYRIVQIDPSTFVNAICYSEKSNIGFLYESSCSMVPQQKSRYTVSIYKETTGNAYAEKIVTANGETTFLKLKDLPSNLHILKMENYWYQESDDPKTNETLVSKTFIINLLREDIRRIAPKLEAARSNGQSNPK